jgi:hypothetical protein
MALAAELPDRDSAGSRAVDRHPEVETSLRPSRTTGVIPAVRTGTVVIHLLMPSSQLLAKIFRIVKPTYL